MTETSSYLLHLIVILTSFISSSNQLQQEDDGTGWRWVGVATNKVGQGQKPQMNSSIVKQYMTHMMYNSYPALACCNPWSP